jgi:transcriptional regulator with XRE-family HTH domain
MASIITGNLIKELRRRRRWQRCQLLRGNSHAELTAGRVECNVQNPMEDTYRDFMTMLEMPVEDFFYTNMNIYRSPLLDCLAEPENTEAQAEAARLIALLEEKKGFKKDIYRQFLLSCKARLYRNTGAALDTIKKTVREGMAVTFPEFDENNLTDEMLILEEPALLHTLALACADKGDYPEAIRILQYIRKGLDKLPEDEREKEKKLPLILLSLADNLMRVSEYAQALEICELGYAASVKRQRGRCCPDFAYRKALALERLGQNGECKLLLHLAYFGYTLLRNPKMAERVREDAKGRFNIEINTYGCDTLEFIKYSFQPKPYDAPVECDKIGNFIRVLRKRAGISQAALCQGICDISVLSRIENNKIQANVYFLEAFMQRLGRDINLYFTTFLSAHSFYEKQKRDEIMSRLVNRQYDAAEKLLAELETSEAYHTGVNLQFIKNAKASIIESKEGYNNNHINMVREALKITRPDFDENKIPQYRLTYYELMLINKMAIHDTENNNRNHGLKIFERLRDSMNGSYADESEKIRMYSVVLYNYSKNLGLQKRYDEALEIIAEGEELELRHGSFKLLPDFSINKACDLLEMGEKEKSVPYFALAYYGSLLLKDDAAVINDYVRERLGIEFDGFID